MIVAGLATIPERAAYVRRVVDSIIGQVDRLHIGFNGYDRLPSWLKDVPWYKKKIVGHLTDNDRWGDAAKFVGLTDDYEYYLSIDDDLVYPPGYAHYMTRWCETLGHNVASLHGTRFHSFPIESYFQGREGVQCLHPWGSLVKVQFPGTGVSCIHRSMGLRQEEFRSPNMADVWLGIAAHARGMGVFALPHPGGYLGYLNPPEEETLWYRYRRDDALHVQAINEAFSGVAA